MLTPPPLAHAQDVAPPPLAEARSLFELIDTDASGGVEFPEFARYLTERGLVGREYDAENDPDAGTYGRPGERRVGPRRVRDKTKGAAAKKKAQLELLGAAPGLSRQGAHTSLLTDLTEGKGMGVGDPPPPPAESSSSKGGAAAAAARRTVSMLPCPLDYQQRLIERARSASLGRNYVHEAADEELEQATAFFYRFDLHGRGALTWEEFQRLVMHLEERRGPRVKGAVKASERVSSLRRLFAEGDLDHDGELDLNEYLRIQRHRLARVTEDSAYYPKSVPGRTEMRDALLLRSSEALDAL